MHHLLRFYGKHPHLFLRLYILAGKLTKIPLFGRLVYHIANLYGQSQHQGYLITLTEAEEIIEASRSVALGPCSCRQVFGNCHSPILSEIGISVGNEIFSKFRVGFREITKAEAKEIMRQGQEKRLMLTLMRCREHFYAICQCCSCCCVPTRLRQKYGIQYALIRSKEVVEEFQRLAYQNKAT